MTSAELDTLIDALAPALGLNIDPAWRDAVRANLAVTLRMATVVDAFKLPDEAGAAPVFTA